jgi:protease I
MKSIAPGKRFIFGMMVSLLILSTSSGVLSQDQGKRLEGSGAIYTGNPLEVDGNIVTADSYKTAEEFAKTILSMILQK